MPEEIALAWLQRTMGYPQSLAVSFLGMVLHREHLNEEMVRPEWLAHRLVKDTQKQAWFLGSLPLSSTLNQDF